MNDEKESICLENKEKKETKQGLIKARSIFLSGHIDEKTAKTVIESLLQLESESPLEDVFFYIDSYGGYIDSMFAIIDTMNLVHPDINTICIGKAMSAAVVVLSSGAKGKRFITPNGKTMIHQVFAHAFGPANYIEIEAEDIKKDQQRMERLLAKNTGQSMKTIKDDVAIMKYMNAEESVLYGLVDAVKKRR